MRTLLICLSLTSLAALSLGAQKTGDHATILRGDGATFATRPDGPDCATSAPAHGDPATGPAVFLVKLDAGCTVPWHWHTANENVIPVSGLIQVSMKGEKPIVVKSGDYIFMPSQHVHQAKCAGSKPCSMYTSIDAALDIHYVDAVGKEIAAEQALAKVNKDVKKAPAGLKQE
jgi:quercetin dioxygenase-like cupin family protein